MQRERTPDATIGTDRVRVRLRGFVPGASLAHLVFAPEHQCASRAAPDTVATIHTGRICEREREFGRDTRVKATPGDRDGKSILRLDAAGFHTFVAQDAAGII